ncbi:hypothetical protein I350_06110 [Cryptococcus amylolentus CBS 6273]|uniref:Uncharacterized protein n=1 Tax=Cryptococcus amylolentus CBS 6273 TaxID=1296118 RepID=A0A1E3JTK0_9TREE|nr:hypothetical protein I350_06110 [Cryptococcus amylolentus CBS 6273]
MPSTDLVQPSTAPAAPRPTSTKDRLIHSFIMSHLQYLCRQGLLPQDTLKTLSAYPLESVPIVRQRLYSSLTVSGNPTLDVVLPSRRNTHMFSVQPPLSPDYPDFLPASIVHQWLWETKTVTITSVAGARRLARASDAVHGAYSTSNAVRPNPSSTPSQMPRAREILQQSQTRLTATLHADLVTFQRDVFLPYRNPPNSVIVKLEETAGGDKYGFLRVLLVLWLRRELSELPGG